MSRGIRRIAAGIVLCAFCVVGRADAGQADAALLALTGNELLKRADRMLNDRLFQAEQAASGLVNQTLNGLSVLAEAARLNMGDITDRTLKEMNAQQRQVFLNLQAMMDDVEKQVEKAYAMEEVANIDVSNRLGEIPGIPHAVFISSVRGLSVKEWEDSHSISVIATGLGPGEAGVKAEVTFRLDGRQLQPRNIDLSQHNQGRYVFSTSQLVKPGTRNAPRSVLIAVHLSVERSSWGGLSTSRKDIDTKINLTLYPRVAGTLDITYDIPVFDYTLLERRTQPFRTRDCGNSQCGGGGQNTDVSTTAVANGDVHNPPEGNRKVANPSMSCGPDWWDPAGCNYVYDHRVAVNANKTAIDAHWRNTGVWVTMHVSYDVLQWSRISPKSGSQSMTFEYNRVVDICLPPKVDFAKVRGRLLTKQEFEVTLGASVSKILQFQGKSTCPDGGDRYAYLVLPPS